MIHFQTRSQEELRESLSNYHLNLEVPTHIKSVWRLAEHVINSCYNLIPNTFIQLFNEELTYTVKVRNGTDFTKNEVGIFKDDLCYHLMFNSFSTINLEGNKSTVNSNRLIRIVDTFFFNKIKNRSEDIFNLFDEESDILRNAQNNLKNKIGDEFSLPKSSGVFTTPMLLSPYISYTSLNYKIHKVLKEHGIMQSNFLKKILKVSNQFHLYFYDNFEFLIDNFEEMEGFNKTFDSNFKKYSLMNKIVFEKEYNLGLASKIFIMCADFDEKEQLYNILSIISLFPNVNGRLFYLNKLLFCLEFHQNVYLSKRNLRDFVIMSTLIIPIMESLFIYLWKELEYHTSDYDMLMIMSKYENNNYSKQKTVPEPRFLKKGKGEKAKHNQIYGYQAFNVLEMANIPFKCIDPIIMNINKIKDMQKNMSTVFLSPQNYLVSKRNYDEFKVLAISENPSSLIEALADEFIADFSRCVY